MSVGSENRRLPWTQDAPPTWPEWKITHAFDKLGSGTTPPSGQYQWYEGGTIPWVTTGELRESVIFGTSKSVTPAAVKEFSALRVHPEGSLAVAMYGATIGRLGILGVPATTNQACCVLSGSRHLDTKFTYYWLYAFRPNVIDWFATGGGQPNINQETISSLRLPCPQLESQREIATALDRETARIDALIEKKTRFIKLLKEKRQALITQAVTKGLDPGVPMKDSGVEWIGEVPAHWEVLPIKRLVSIPITDGPHETPMKQNEGIPFVSAEAVRTGYIDFDKIWGYISEADHAKYSKKYKPKVGDIYMVKSGATTGVTAMVEDPREFNIWSPLAAMRPNNLVEPNYLLAALRSTSFLDGVAINWSYGTQQNIGMKTLSDLPVAVPSRKEQRKICAAIACEGERVAKLLHATERSIELLKERRSALITAAVTGQIDLRENAA